ncbi:DUF1549 domain-containing protein [Planctomycetaceae bacterium SH139]
MLFRQTLICAAVCCGLATTFVGVGRLRAESPEPVSPEPVIAADKSDAAAGDTLVVARTVQLQFNNPTAATKLRGQDARVQLVVAGANASGDLRDVTRQVHWRVVPEGIVNVDSSGYVVPVADGDVTIIASLPDGSPAGIPAADPQTAEFQLSVTDTGNEPPLSFPGRIVPIFTKLGCNGGGCHGKAAGQNGFQLSLLGFEPREDYKHLVGESRGRRVSPALPDHSLLLLKAINASPHGGGQRLEKDSHEYRILRRWIAQGMPYGEGEGPQVESIQVVPQHRRLYPAAEQQLAVVATYSDGTVEDVTRAAVFESNDPDMAEVSPTGLVKLGSMIGDVAVMARYQGQVTVFRADIPLPAEQLQLTAGESLTPEPRNVVDTHVFAKLQSLGIPASGECDDATYLRRVTLDIAGRLPTLAETEQFEQDQGADKREQLVERLLASQDYAEYFASKWNAILRNRRQRGELHYSTMAFYDWIRSSLDANKPYDQFVHEIISAAGSVANNPPVAWYQQVPDINQRVEDAAQLFLGQRVQCARCHHHPYEKWSQADYARMAAFFATVTKRVDGDPVEPMFFTRVAAATQPDPKSGQALAPAGLDSEPLPIDVSEDPRMHLADWMTNSENPFFAKALVNRYWKHFFGRGLIEPEDDLRVTNPPSNPVLLDALADSFVESGYDLKALIRLLVLSRSYSLDHQPRAANLGDERSYSRFYPKRLQAEVLLDAVDRVTLSETRFGGMPAGTRAVALPDTAFESYFLDVFGQPSASTACECERTQDANLAQSLHLLNSEEMQNKLSGAQARAAQLAADNERSNEAKISELYRLAFSRPPREQEMQATLNYLAGKENQQEAYEDIIWSLVNSKEFLFNH